MTCNNKCVPILTKKHFYLIYAALCEIVVSFVQLKCWTDTKLETVWNSLIVYNVLCACSFPREGTRCIHGMWEDSKQEDLKVTVTNRKPIIKFLI